MGAMHSFVRRYAISSRATKSHRTPPPWNLPTAFAALRPVLLTASLTASLATFLTASLTACDDAADTFTSPSDATSPNRPTSPDQPASPSDATNPTHDNSSSSDWNGAPPIDPALDAVHADDPFATPLLTPDLIERDSRRITIIPDATASPHMLDAFFDALPKDDAAQARLSLRYFGFILIRRSPQLLDILTRLPDFADRVTKSTTPPPHPTTSTPTS